MRTITAFIFTALISGFSSLFSQNDSVKYTPDFKFVDGIYRTFEEFKENNPSIKRKAVLDDNPGMQFFVGRFTKAEKIAYKDSTGNMQIIKRKDVWGYCSNDVVYIKYNRNFHRILKIGSIIFFIELYNTSTTYYQDPIKFIPYFRTNSSIEYQYIIDFKTGDILKYDLNNFLALLFDDKDLYNKFMAIPSDRKRKKQMFNYLNKFNERNPVYFKLNPNKQF